MNRNVYLTVDFFLPKLIGFFCHFQVKPALLEVHISKEQLEGWALYGETFTKGVEETKWKY